MNEWRLVSCRNNDKNVDMSEYGLEKHKRDIIKSFPENTWINQDLKNFTWVLCFDSDGKYRALGETGWRHFSTWMFRSMGGWRVCGVTRWSRSIYWNTHKVFCALSLSDKWSPSYLLLLKTHTSPWKQRDTGGAGRTRLILHRSPCFQEFSSLIYFFTLLLNSEISFFYILVLFTYLLCFSDMCFLFLWINYMNIYRGQIFGNK